MARRIVWSKNATDDLQRIIQYLKREWSNEIAYKFEKKLFLRIDLISKFPKLGKQSDNLPKIRKLVITKQNSMYYKVDDEFVIILNLFDNRQSPDKLEY